MELKFIGQGLDPNSNSTTGNLITHLTQKWRKLGE